MTDVWRGPGPAPLSFWHGKLDSFLNEGTATLEEARETVLDLRKEYDADRKIWEGEERLISDSLTEEQGRVLDLEDGTGALENDLDELRAAVAAIVDVLEGSRNLTDLEDAGNEAAALLPSGYREAS